MKGGVGRGKREGGERSEGGWVRFIEVVGGALLCVPYLPKFTMGVYQVRL